MARELALLDEIDPARPRQSKTPVWLAVFAAALVATRIAARDERRTAAAGRAPQDLPVGGDSEGRRRAAERGRGRRASTPSEIPARGWKDVLTRVFREISDDRVLANAAGVTYYAMLALFPAIAALVSIYGLFSDPASIERQLAALSGVLPAGAIEVIGEQLRRVSGQGAQTLGLTFAIGLAVSLWTANAAVKALIDSLNVVYNEKEKRGFVKLTAASLAFTVSGILFVVVALTAVAVLPPLLDAIGLGGALEWTLRIARWPLLLLFLGIGLAVLYRFGPSRERAQWRWISWGSAFAAIAWIGASMLFSWYTANFANYNETYGSLGAIIGFMTWLWISAAVVLIGAEINAEMEHQTARDTTEGRPAPLGARGARMADTVGEAH